MPVMWLVPWCAPASNSRTTRNAVNRPSSCPSSRILLSRSSWVSTLPSAAVVTSSLPWPWYGGNLCTSVVLPARTAADNPAQQTRGGTLAGEPEGYRRGRNESGRGQGGGRVCCILELNHHVDGAGDATRLGLAYAPDKSAAPAEELQTGIHDRDGVQFAIHRRLQLSAECIEGEQVHQREARERFSRSTLGGRVIKTKRV